jgi:hypothetical protein
MAVRAKIEMTSGNILGAEAIKNDVLEKIEEASRNFKTEMKGVIMARTPVYTGSLRGDLLLNNSNQAPGAFTVNAPNSPYYRYVKALNLGETPRAPKAGAPATFIRKSLIKSKIGREQLISVLGGQAKDIAKRCYDEAMASSGLDLGGV